MDKRKEIVLGAAQDKDEEVRKAASEALEKLQVRERLDFLEDKLSSGEMLERVRAVYALAELRGEKVVSLISKVVKDQAEDVRAAAARALGLVGDSRALPALVELLKDSSPVVVRSALDSISRYNEPKALGPLMQALKNADAGVVEKAIEAVGRIGDKRAEEAMVYFAVKGNNRMRANALRALGLMEK